MKKLWMLLIALALLVTAVPMFASDVTFSGRMIWAANYDDGDAASGLVRFRPKLTAKVDDFNTLVAEFRAEGWNVVDAVVPTAIWTGVRVRDLYLTTDVTGALGLDLPVTIKTTFGQFEPGFTDWGYVSESGWENYFGLPFGDWNNFLADYGPLDKQMTAQVDIGFGPAAFHVYSDFLGFMMFGLSGGFGPVTGWVTYQAPIQLGGVANYGATFGEGILGVEAKYTAEFGDIKLGVPVFFRYSLFDMAPFENFTYGVGASVDYTMFHVAAGLEGDEVDTLDNVVIDVGVKPLEALQLKANTYLNLAEAATSVLAGVDIQANYMLGAAKFMVGYVIGGDDLIPIPINGDTFKITNGLYMAVDISF